MHEDLAADALVSELCDACVAVGGPNARREEDGIKWNWRLHNRREALERAVLLAGDAVVAPLVRALDHGDDRVAGFVASTLALMGHAESATAAMQARAARGSREAAATLEFLRRSDLARIRELHVAPAAEMARIEETGYAYEHRPAETLAAVRARFAAAAWPESARRIGAVLRPCVRLWSTLTSQDAIAPGASRYGGLPDLPAGFVWPRTADFPFGFIAQIECSRLPRSVVEDGFPSTGHLAYFREYAGDAWGYAASHAGNWSLSYFDVPAHELVRTPYPSDLDAEGRFHAASVELEEAVAVPSSQDRRRPSFEDLAAWFPMRDEFDSLDESAGYDVLGGYSESIQHTAEFGVPGETEPWRLVLEIASNACGWVWGSHGTIYVLMRRDDLAARAFDRSWTILQCT